MTTPAPMPDAAEYPLTKDCNILQLQDEIAEAAAKTVTLALSGDENFDPLAPVSVDNPMILWVRPDTISASIITDAIANHIADPVYNVPAEDLAFQAAMDKITDNFAAVLTDEERDVLLKGVALRQSQVNTLID